MGEVIYLEVPKQMTPEQRDYWHGQASYWAVCEENALKALEVAQRGRETALRMLGMLGTEAGLGE